MNIQKKLFAGVFLLCDDDVFSALIQLKCCGFTNFTDFVGSEFEKENGGGLPPSCCRTNSAPCRSDEAEQSAVQVRWKLKKHLQSTGKKESLFSVTSLVEMGWTNVSSNIMQSFQQQHAKKLHSNHFHLKVNIVTFMNATFITEL